MFNLSIWKTHIPLFEPKSNLEKVMDLEDKKVGIYLAWMNFIRSIQKFFEEKYWIILNVILSPWKLELKPLLVVRWKDKSWKVHLDTRHLINKADLVLSHVQKSVPKSNIKILGLLYVSHGYKLFALAYFYVA